MKKESYKNIRPGMTIIRTGKTVGFELNVINRIVHNCHYICEKVDITNNQIWLKGYKSTYDLDKFLPAITSTSHLPDFL